MRNTAMRVLKTDPWPLTPGPCLFVRIFIKVMEKRDAQIFSMEILFTHFFPITRGEQEEAMDFCGYMSSILSQIN